MIDINTEMYINDQIKLGMLEEKQKNHDSEFTKLSNAITHLDNKMDSHFKWILATIIGLFVGVFGVIFPLMGTMILHGLKLV